jgi:hypothetical protein
MTYVYEEVTLAELFERFAGENSYEQPKIIDISDIDLEIEGWDFETNSSVYSKVNALLIKEPVTEHWKLGDLHATSGHLVYDHRLGAYVRMDQHKDAVKIEEPMLVVDLSVDKIKNYIANGQINHNTTPGGKALKHACSVMVEVGPMGGADNIIFDAREEKQGHRIRAKISKNKLGAPAKVAEFFVDFRSGISKIDEELLDLGVKIELFERPNNRSYVIAGEKLSSRDQAIEYITQNRQMVEDMIRGHYMSGGDSVRESEIAETEVSKDPFSDEEEDVA